MGHPCGAVGHIKLLDSLALLPQENYDDSLSCGNQTVSPKIHGFTYHSLPEVLQANYRISDFTDPESLRICTKGLFLQCT